MADVVKTALEGSGAFYLTLAGAVAFLLVIFFAGRWSKQ